MANYTSTILLWMLVRLLFYFKQYNYSEKVWPFLLTAGIDTRSGNGKIKSRIGLEKLAQIFSKNANLFTQIKKLIQNVLFPVFVDEAQFLSTSKSATYKSSGWTINSGIVFWTSSRF